MFGKRLGGLVFGLLLGCIPLINTVICITTSFAQKRKREGFYFVVLGVVSVISLVITDKENAFRENLGTALFSLCYLTSLVSSVVLGWRTFVTKEDLAPSNARTAGNNRRDALPVANILPDVNVNTAGESELTRLPGINLILAKAIIGERRRNGYFADAFDLERRMGFTPEQMGDLMLTTSFEVAGTDLQQKKSDGTDRKESGTGKGRIIEF